MIIKLQQYPNGIRIHHYNHVKNKLGRKFLKVPLFETLDDAKNYCINRLRINPLFIYYDHTNL